MQEQVEEFKRTLSPERRLTLRRRIKRRALNLSQSRIVAPADLPDDEVAA